MRKRRIFDVTGCL